MFKKLISNLAFNPSLINQIGFYSKRLKREAVVRRAGVVLLAITLGLQVFAVVSPPQPTLASSNNDMVNGGFSKREEAVDYCNHNIRNYRTLLGYYGIGCEDLGQAETVTISSTDYNKRLYTMGHLAYGKAGETPIRVPGNSETAYMRYLWSWDKSGSHTSYKALKGTAKDGKEFFVLYNCGNLVTVGLPTPPKQCEFNSALLADSKDCFEPCPISGHTTERKDSSSCTTAQCPYNKKLTSKDAKCFEPCPVKGKETLPKTSQECYVPCQYNSLVSENDAACKPCQASQTHSDLSACIEYHKTVSNTTRGLQDANGITANAGDLLTYTLTTSNKGKVTIPAYSVSENLSDVLDYATVVNLNGGNLGNDGVVTWPVADIAGGKTLTTTFTMRVRSPLPSTPTSATDRGHYDLTMTNAYGNTVSIKLPASITKTTEVIASQLPNTGPGTTISIAFAATLLAGYLFARARLMSKELTIVRQEFGRT